MRCNANSNGFSSSRVIPPPLPSQPIYPLVLETKDGHMGAASPILVNLRLGDEPLTSCRFLRSPWRVITYWRHGILVFGLFLAPRYYIPPC